MVSFPSELAAWIQPGAIGAGFAVVWAETRSLHRRVDEVREDMKAGFAQDRAENAKLREDMMAGFAQDRADMKEGFAQARAENTKLREDMMTGFAQARADTKALNDKLDQLVEALLTAKQA